MYTSCVCTTDVCIYKYLHTCVRMIPHSSMIFIHSQPGLVLKLKSLNNLQ